MVLPLLLFTYIWNATVTCRRFDRHCVVRACVRALFWLQFVNVLPMASNGHPFKVIRPVLVKPYATLWRAMVGLVQMSGQTEPIVLHQLW